MQQNEESANSDFGLPQPVLAVLPTDPFEQLDVARKITSIALATRVSKLESETGRLRLKVSEKDELIEDLQAQVTSLDASLSDTVDKLERALEEKKSLASENASLSSTVKKLTRDVSKLEIFRKTLMQSLQEEEESSDSAPRVVAKQETNAINFSSVSGYEDASLVPKMKPPSVRAQLSESGSAFSLDGGVLENDALSGPFGADLASQTSSLRITPPDSPPRVSAVVSPTGFSQPTSPRRHSMSLSSARSMVDDRSLIFSSMPANYHSSMSGSLDAGSQAGRRVDGKEFFRQVRSRLSYEQFGAFLASVKELNAHRQTKEDTLQKANEIFGLENKDLYKIFEGLITRTPVERNG